MKVRNLWKLFSLLLDKRCQSRMPWSLPFFSHCPVSMCTVTIFWQNFCVCWQVITCRLCDALWCVMWAQSILKIAIWSLWHFWYHQVCVSWDLDVMHKIWDFFSKAFSLPHHPTVAVIQVRRDYVPLSEKHPIFSLETLLFVISMSCSCHFLCQCLARHFLIHVIVIARHISWKLFSYLVYL